jgi:hypothetical protein
LVVTAKQPLRAINLIEHTKGRCRPRRVLLDEISGISEIINRAQPNAVSVHIDFEKIKPIVHSASQSVSRAIAKSRTIVRGKPVQNLLQFVIYRLSPIA